jgi:hypothetical protein
MRLLKRFESIFSGQVYKHRRSNLGDLIAIEFYEDLVSLKKSTKLASRISSHDRVINLRNITIGKKTRRGDGTLGELVPTAVAVVERGFAVARGPTANLEIGAEAKILAKAMIKQIDRVIGDLKRQLEMFKKQGGNPICIGFVGINYANEYTSYEGDRAFPTDGKRYPHPIQEAKAAEIRLVNEAKPSFDEFLILPFKATNSEPYPFEWVNHRDLQLEYGALLTRVAREYDSRF